MQAEVLLEPKVILQFNYVWFWGLGGMMQLKSSAVTFMLVTVCSRQRRSFSDEVHGRSRGFAENPAVT